LSSTVYSGPIGVSATMMIKAKAFKDGMTDSDTSTATYTVNIVTPPPSAITPEVLYASIIIVIAAIAGVVLLLLRKSKSASPLKQSTMKPKLTKR